jgi:hypothetical protein
MVRGLDPPDNIPGVFERPEVDPKGYERGKVPALRDVSEPTMMEVANLTPEQRQEMVWKSFSTTQGRRSSVGPIQAHILEGLRGEGLSVKPLPEDIGQLPGAPVSGHEWTIRMAGRKNVQSLFSPVSVAREALLKGLLRDLPSKYRELPLRLGVAPVNTVNDRRVGWQAGLFLVVASV